MKSKNGKSKLLLLAVSGILASGASLMGADWMETKLDEADVKIKETIPGKINIDVRTRYEIFETPTLDLDGWSQRIRYGYTTPSFEGFTGMVEGETLYALGKGKDIHPLDNAGDGTDLNQLWVQYKNADYGSAKLGRQIFTLDDHRFIGHVGWRQNIQTFDALTASLTPIKDLVVIPFYIDQANRVNDDNAEMSTYGINISYPFGPAAKITGFYYSTGVDARQGLGQNASNDTFGMRAAGAFSPEETKGVKFIYALSLAKQYDNSSNTAGTNFDVDFYSADIAAEYKGATLGGGWEILGSDGTNGFRTPLATVHAFNGYADVFLPLTGFANGLDDKYIYAGYKIPVGNGVGVKAIYHWFTTTNGGGNYGEEIDLVASYKINKYVNVMAKYGDYSADSGVIGLGSTDKKMFTFDVNFKY